MSDVLPFLLVVLMASSASFCSGVWLTAKYHPDSDRLNWLEDTRSEIDTDGPGFVVYNDSEGEKSELGGGASNGSFRDLRSAIDAARNKAK